MLDDVQQEGDVGLHAANAVFLKRPLHPQRSVLYRAVGQGEGLEVDIISRRIDPGARLLLCSDGMWGLVPDHVILQIMRNAAGPQAAATALVEAANQAGGPDNISVIIVQFPG